MPIINGNDKVQDFKNNPEKITSQKNQVHRWQWPLWHHQPSGQELAEASDVHQDIRMWLAQNGAVKNPVVFSSKENSKREKRNFFFFWVVGWGGQPKRSRVAMPSLPEFSAEVPLNDEKFQSWKERAQLVKNFLCVFASRKTWGTNFCPTFFVWLNTGGSLLLLLIWRRTRSWKLGFWHVPLALPQISFRKSWKVLRGGQKVAGNFWKIPIMNPGFKNLVSLAGFWLWSDYSIEISKPSHIEPLTTPSRRLKFEFKPIWIWNSVLFLLNFLQRGGFSHWS